MSRHNFKKIAGAVCAAVLLLASCASSKKPLPVEPVALLDPSATFYVYIPVRAHEGFVRRVLSSVAGASGGDAERIVRRTDTVCIALVPGTGAEIAAGGNFPVTAANLVFTEKKGWKKQAHGAFTFYEHGSPPLQVAFPSADTACVSSGVSRALDRYAAASAGGDIEMLPAEMHAFLLGEDAAPAAAQEIRFCSSVPDAALGAGVLGDFPVDAMFGVLTEGGAAETFDLALTLSLSDHRTVRAAAAMLRLALLATGAKVSQSGDAEISITGLSFTWDELFAMLFSAE